MRKGRKMLQMILILKDFCDIRYPDKCRVSKGIESRVLVVVGIKYSFCTWENSLRYIFNFDLRQNGIVKKMKETIHRIINRRSRKIRIKRVTPEITRRRRKQVYKQGGTITSKIFKILFKHLSDLWRASDLSTLIFKFLKLTFLKFPRNNIFNMWNTQRDGNEELRRKYFMMRREKLM